MPLKNIKRYVLFCFCFAGLSYFGNAQNLPYADYKPIHFGFSLGFNTMDFGVTPSLDSVGSGKKVYNAAVSTLKPGFSVGIVSDLRINRYLNLRFTPTLHFGERQLNYVASGGTLDSVSFISIPVSFPLYLKYSAERKDNYRPYVIWGVGSYIDLGRNKENKAILQPIDFYTEFGVGCDLYFPFFKLSPELKFALGFNDMIDHKFEPANPNDKIYSQAISRLTSRMVTLTFNFE
jgi:hypothetical protein